MCRDTKLARRIARRVRLTKTLSYDLPFMKTSDFISREYNRRQFLGSSAKNAAGMAAGMVGLASHADAAGSLETVRVGVIGVRNQGRKLAAEFAGLGCARVTRVCDVDDSLQARTLRELQAIQGVTPRWDSDFRRMLDDESIDAVVIATPDHWHVPMAIRACEAGKDLYIEKPVTHAPAEAEPLRAAVQQHHTLVQCGLQQRSGPHFRDAVEYVQSGKLGPIRLAKAWTAHQRKAIGHKSDMSVPAGVDYEMWLGPAPRRSFHPNRFHYNWRWFWDYGSGELGNWGVPMLDLVRWALRLEWPERILAAGGQYHFRDDQQTPDTLSVHYGFADLEVQWEHRLWTSHGIEGRSAAAAFYGDSGTLIVDRGGWKVYNSPQQPSGNPRESDLRAHCRDFVLRVRDRGRPAADLETGLISSNWCHLGNIAYQTGRPLLFQPQTQRFSNDDEANAALSCPHRSPWSLEIPAV